MALFVLQRVGEARKAGDARPAEKIAVDLMKKLSADPSSAPRR
jgi:hypothetical protein